MAENFYITDGSFNLQITKGDINTDHGFAPCCFSINNQYSEDTQTRLYNDFLTATKRPNESYKLGEFSVEKLTGDNSYIFVSPVSFSEDELKELKKYNKDNPIKEHVYVLGESNDVELVETQIQLYDKDANKFITISADKNGFNKKTIPDDLQTIFQNISPEQLEAQQTQQVRLHNHPLMNIGDHYFVIEPNYYYDHERDELQKLINNTIIMEKSGRCSLPKVKTPSPNNNQAQLLNKNPTYTL